MNDKIEESPIHFEIIILIIKGIKTEKAITRELIDLYRPSRTTRATNKILKSLGKKGYIKHKKYGRPREYEFNYNGFIKGLISRRNELAEKQFRSHRKEIPYKKYQKRSIRNHFKRLFFELINNYPEELKKIYNLQDFYDSYIEQLLLLNLDMRWSKRSYDKLLCEWINNIILERGRANLNKIILKIIKDY